jgi:5-(carboxyamino)imidazole ribonucleotide mutase
MAIGASGAANAALLAVAMLAAGGDAELRAKLVAWRAARRDEVLAQGLDDLAELEIPTKKAGV